MRKTRPLALLSAGPIRADAAARLPAIQQRLGPVWGSSFPVSCRLVNGLGAGYAARRMSEALSCDLILVNAPRPHLASLMSRMASAGDWWGKTVLLDSDGPDSRALEPLARRGAATGSIVPLEGIEEPWYVIEGDPAARREARALVKAAGARVLELTPEAWPLWSAAQSFTDVLMVPLLSAAADAMRAAGVPSHQAGPMAEMMLRRTWRAYRKAGKQAWRAPALWTEPEAVERQRQALDRLNPRLRRLFDSLLAQAVDVLEREERLRAASAGS